MIFNSFLFIVFFVITMTLYYTLRHRYRWVMLLVASVIFYMAWSPLLMLVLMFSVTVNYVTALNLSGPHRKWWLAGGIILSFGVLFVFKYLMFFTDSAAGILHMLGQTATPPEFDIILPLGISFYTFQAVGYTIDVYRSQQEPQRNFLKFTLFITFFPQLVAGPIERAANLMPQLFTQKAFKLDNIIIGLQIMLIGFFKKVVIADRLAVCVDTVYGAPGQFEGLAFIIATVMFAFQIYCDFSGYSDIAIGCARMMGIDLMQNFKQPYFSRGIKAFWRRWHVSLSSWFKDYVYFPLGGNRVPKLRHYFNTMVTFLVSGLWHGADWTFVLWGALHGGYQVAGAALPKPPKWLDKLLIAKIAGVVFTFALVNFAWIFFRANNISDALFITSNLFTGHGQWTSVQYVFNVLNSLGLQFVELVAVTGCVLVLLTAEFFCGEKPMYAVLLKTPGVFRFAFYGLLAVLIMCLGVYYNGGEFIYFQF